MTLDNKRAPDTLLSKIQFKRRSNMKSLRCTLPAVLLSLSIAAFAQHDAQMATAPKTDAQKSFETMKTLAGTWEGRITTTPAHPEMDGSLGQVTFRVTSMGNALMHDMKSSVRPDNPITMMYLDNDRLLLTHFCDAGNRPRMVARPSADGKQVEFDFLDVAGGTQYGHMDHAVFTIVDDNHHIEDWTYMEPGDKPIHAHIDLQRSKDLQRAKSTASNPAETHAQLLIK